LRDLLPIDNELLIERYWAALSELGIDVERRSRIHIDAAGFSPELADELKDAHYLRSGVLHAHAILVSEEQLRAPLVHPSLGYAAEGFRAVTRKDRREIAAITRREPILGEVRQPSTHFSSPEQLADLSSFEIHFRTPGGLVKGARRLESMKDEFMRSQQRWLDDDFIAEMLELAGRVRDLGTLSERFVTSRHSLGLFYAPAFGGTYVLEEGGASASRATTWVLTIEPGNEIDSEYRSARGRRVVVETLDTVSACAALERHGIAAFNARELRRSGELARIRRWLALDHLLGRDPARVSGSASDAELLALMRAESDPPAEYSELEDVIRRVEAGRGHVDLDSLSPATRLRVLCCTSSREDVRRFVAHMKAFVDPLDLEGGIRYAPDVFFGRLPALGGAQRGAFGSWLDGSAVELQ
jgi:hypothetical protein